MRYIIYTILLLHLSYATIAQKPFNQDPGNPNLDFSLGNFSNWQLSWGNRGTPYINNGMMTGAGSHTIVEIYGTNWDGNAGTGGLKRVPDGLAKVARLGAPAGGGYGNPKSYAMKYDITVNAAYPILFFQLASIMDITHGDAENTNYQFSIKNASGGYLFPQPCGGIQLTSRGRNATPAGNVYSSPPLSSYSFLPEIGSILYQPWQSVAVDLSSYAGQTITIAYEHSDCWTGHHGSYSYISAAMRSPYDTFHFCHGAAAATIRPYLPDFRSYLWNTGSTTDSIIISNPADGAIYTCQIGSYNGCSTTFTYILKEIKTNADFNFVGGGICNQIQFLDRSATNAGHIDQWQWNFGDPGSGAANTGIVPDPLHTYPGPGDYTVSLTVTDTSGCTHTIARTVSVSPEGTRAQIGLPDTSCISDTLAFEDLTVNTSRRTWFIDDLPMNDTSKTLHHIFDQAGTYKVKLIAIGNNGCPDTATQTFRVYDLPRSAIQVSPFTNAAPVTDPVFMFKGFEENAAGYVWNFGYGSAAGQGQYTSFTYPPEIAEYIVTLKTYDKNGCHNTASESVKIMPPGLMVPNAFSPNGDGSNDVFKVVNITSQTLKEFSVYNRYGQRVFYTLQPGSGWDGTFNGGPCDVGTYYYVLRYSMPGSDQEYMMKGDVTLIR